MKEPESEDKPSLWERLGEQERERRIREYIENVAATLSAEQQRLPSITDRIALCTRCGQGQEKHTVSTIDPGLEEREMTVFQDADGSVVLGDIPYRRNAYGLGFPRLENRVVHTFRRVTPMKLQVVCECGKQLGLYRPLDQEQSHVS
ncbi:hypothetical protein [Mycobacterium sp. E1747]|uniref:hypothetical protein n=1 Tax=Mycobacterium sp. E1747 TaxID=1834128 RepID=UPI000802022C|nr:hypothetical protein [Mycobacterium sp. E1747]OBH08945.1 hypothetical protein A5695_25250 [Mycobacterium sp. E1747]